MSRTTGDPGLWLDHGPIPASPTINWASRVPPQGQADKRGG